MPISRTLPRPSGLSDRPVVRILRHADACRRLNISRAKLFDMCAKGEFPKPFPIIPGGRAVGWLEQDVEAWIVGRRDAAGDEVRGHGK